MTIVIQRELRNLSIISNGSMLLKHERYQIGTRARTQRLRVLVVFRSVCEGARAGANALRPRDARGDARGSGGFVAAELSD